MEARAITCFNTGNLVFKDWNPHKFTGKHAGDRWCLFSVCEGRDSYYHMRFECHVTTMRAWKESILGVAEWKLITMVGECSISWPELNIFRKWKFTWLQMLLLYLIYLNKCYIHNIVLFLMCMSVEPCSIKERIDTFHRKWKNF